MVGAACGDRSAPRAGPILVIGLDGLEWDVLLPLFARGELPHLARLGEEGAYGLLRSQEPTESPILWTSIATGKTAEQHGIRGFVKPGGRGSRLYTNADRKTMALWNLASERGLRACTVGWWMTYPVEPIRGVMVAQTNTAGQGGFLWKGRLIPGVPGQVHPPERQAEFMEALAASEAELEATIEAIFGTFSHPLGAPDEALWTKTHWALRADDTYRRIAGTLAANEGCDLLLAYLGATDVAGHYFWRFHDPVSLEPAPSPEQLENFGGVLGDTYRFADRVVGELLAASPPDTTVFIVSDHGMQAARPEDAPLGRKPLELLSDLFVSGQHRHAPPGVLIAAGPPIRPTAPGRPLAEVARGELLEVGSVLDVTPTLLALLRIPLGADMAGRILPQLISEDFDLSLQPEPVATHDTPEFLASRPLPPEADPREGERIEQLRALGYLDEAPEAP